MEKPRLILQKNADKVLNRIILPKKFINEYGREFYMEVYDEKIVLVPVNKKK